MTKLKQFVSRFFLASILNLGFLSLAQAQTIEISTVWERPALKESLAEGRRGVLLSGKTNPGAKITLPTRNIPVLSGEDAQLIPTSSVLRERRELIADALGRFALLMDLPFGTVELPIRIDLGTLNKTYQLQLDVKRESISMKEPEVQPTQTPISENGVRNPVKLPVYRSKLPVPANRKLFLLGAGFSFSNLKTTAEAISSPLYFEANQGPGFSIEYQHGLNSDWMLFFNLNHETGNIKTDAPISDTGFAIDTIDAKAVYTFSTVVEPDFTTRAGWMVGVESMNLPYLWRTSPTQIQLLKNSFLLSVLGFRGEFETQRWIGDFDLAHEYPFLKGDRGMSGFLSFASNMSLHYKLKSKWSVGGVIRGRVHFFAFSYTDPSGTVIYAKTETLQYSDELQVGYAF